MKTCLKCGGSWWPRSEGSPRQCPRCGSSHWDGREDQRIHNRGTGTRNRPTSHGWENYKVGEWRDVGFIFKPKNEWGEAGVWGSVDEAAIDRRYNSMMAYARKSGKVFAFNGQGGKYLLGRVS